MEMSGQLIGKTGRTPYTAAYSSARVLSQTRRRLFYGGESATSNGKRVVREGSQPRPTVCLPNFADKGYVL